MSDFLVFSKVSSIFLLNFHKWSDVQHITSKMMFWVLLFLSSQPPAPTPGLIYFSMATSPDYFFAAPMYQNYVFMAPNYQNYYLTVLLVENISCISVRSKFQTFQLKEDKISNQSRGVATNSGLGGQIQIGTFLYRKYEGDIKECNIVILC